MNEKRKLASIQVIDTISPIPGADKIEVITLQSLGWQCVIRKNEFSVGDKVVYIEVDSKLPPKPEFEFMRERKFKVKTIKLRKQISQGLVCPISILPSIGNVGDDVTDIIGVTNYVKDIENEDDIKFEPKSKVLKWCMQFKPFRTVYHKLNSTHKTNWPVALAGPKTDETRIQVIASALMNHYDEEWYITEKLDGSSSTFFTYDSKIWGFKKRKFGVCSRNIWLKHENKSNF